MQNEAPNNPNPIAGDDPVKALELRKLALEIAEMERPWWKRPNYILAALPTVLAVVALSVGFLNGFFSAQLTKLENQRYDLQTQVRAFEEKRDDLSREYEKTKMELAVTKAQLSATEQQMTLANEQIEVLAMSLKVQPGAVQRAFAQLALAGTSR